MYLFSKLESIPGKNVCAPENYQKREELVSVGDYDNNSSPEHEPYNYHIQSELEITGIIAAIDPLHDVIAGFEPPFQIKRLKIQSPRTPHH
jgi:hypothetical protein